MLNYTISNSCRLEVIFVGSFFVFTKLRKKLHVDLTQVNNTEKALLRYLLAI